MKKYINLAIFVILGIVFCAISYIMQYLPVFFHATVETQDWFKNFSLNLGTGMIASVIVIVLYNLAQDNWTENRINEIMGNLSGGDSIPVAELLLINNSTGDCHLFFHVEGVFPLYDVSARIVDLDNFQVIANRLPNISIQTLTQHDVNVSVGMILPRSGSMIQEWSLGTGDRKSYNIFISSRNGMFNELLRLRKINDEWKIAIKVIKVFGAEQRDVHEKVDPEFPRLPDGSVDLINH